MEVIVKLEQGDLQGSGPFKITWTGYMEGDTHQSIGGFENEPLVPSVPKWQLLNGFTFSALPNGITQIRVKELGPCENYVDINILSEPGDAIVVDPGSNIKIIGSAVAAGFYTMVRYDLYNYKITGAFVNGNAQFDIDGGIYGQTSFPTGTIVDDESLQIPVSSGNYIVTLDISTGVYLFV